MSDTTNVPIPPDPYALWKQLNRPTLGLSDGMTLRDWFAGMALNGALANPMIKGARPELTMEETLAGGSYALADAMMKERAKS